MVTVTRLLDGTTRLDVEFEIAFQCGNRGAQLVRHIAYDLKAAALCLFEGHSERIDTGCQLPKLVGRMHRCDLNPFGIVTRADPSGGLCHLL